MTEKSGKTLFSGNGTDYKHDCPRPMTGCDYPKCRCDVDEWEISKAEMGERDED